MTDVTAAANVAVSNEAITKCSNKSIGALNGAQGEIRLPTQPLDISEVAKVAKISSTVSSPPSPLNGVNVATATAKAKSTTKRLFVRPFEDDYGRSAASVSQNKGKKEPLGLSQAPVPFSLLAANRQSSLNGLEEEKATLHYDDQTVTLPGNGTLTHDPTFSIVDNNNIEFNSRVVMLFTMK